MSDGCKFHPAVLLLWPNFQLFAGLQTVGRLTRTPNPATPLPLRGNAEHATTHRVEVLWHPDTLRGAPSDQDDEEFQHSVLGW